MSILNREAIRRNLEKAFRQDEEAHKENQPPKVQKLKRVRLRDASEAFYERAAIHEMEGGLPREKAETLAERELWNKYLVLTR